MAPQPPPADSPPALLEELIEEILLRLPPDEPLCLLRAALVCKPWSRAVEGHVRGARRNRAPKFQRPPDSYYGPQFLETGLPWRSVICHRGFHRRLHELHGRAPVLGFLRNSPHEGIEGFVTATASAFSLDIPFAGTRRSGRAVDFRHGRALLLSSRDDLIVWDPIAGDQRVVFGPDEGNFCDDPAAAVVCAADGCDHRGCPRGGPFRIVLVSIARGNSDDEHVVEPPTLTSACVYSSETHTWGEIKSIHNLKMYFREHTASVLVGKSLLYFVSDHGEIVECDLARCSLARISPAFEGKAGIHLILTEDGGLGAAELSLDSTSSIHLWSGDVTDHSSARWAKSRVIRLDNLLPQAAISSPSLKLMGFAEGASTILLRTSDGVFTIELWSEQARKLCGDAQVHTLVPIARFYTPPPTTLERAQQLFERGFEAIQKGDFANALDFLSHTIMIRVARYGKFSLECNRRYYKYGCALKETQGMSDPLFSVPKCAPNEQSVKSTTSKDDTINSKAPGSNMEDSSPLKKDAFEEGQNSDGKDQQDMSSDSDYDDDDDDDDDDNISGDESDSDIDLAWEMLDIARALVENSPGTTMEDVKNLSALAEVCLKRGNIDDSLCYYLTALSVLERLVEHDDRRIVELNFCICSVLEVKPKIRDAIRYCAKSITLCKSRIQNLKNAREAMLADKGDSTSAAEGGSVKSTLEDEMVCLAGILAELEKKLEELEQAMSSQAMSDSEKTSGHRIRAKLNLGCVWFLEQD